MSEEKDPKPAENRPILRSALDEKAQKELKNRLLELQKTHWLVMPKVKIELLVAIFLLFFTGNLLATTVQITAGEDLSRGQGIARDLLSNLWYKSEDVGTFGGSGGGPFRVEGIALDDILTGVEGPALIEGLDNAPCPSSGLVAGQAVWVSKFNSALAGGQPDNAGVIIGTALSDCAGTGEEFLLNFTSNIVSFELTQVTPSTKTLIVSEPVIAPLYDALIYTSSSTIYFAGQIPSGFRIGSAGLICDFAYTYKNTSTSKTAYFDMAWRIATDGGELYQDTTDRSWGTTLSNQPITISGSSTWLRHDFTQYLQTTHKGMLAGAWVWWKINRLTAGNTFNDTIYTIGASCEALGNQ